MVDSIDESTTRLRFDISYDGTDFAGWAKQRDQRTVQGEVERVLGHLVGAAVELTCAGRTDSGVHARGQVAHADIDGSVQLVVERVNRALPDDVRVTALTEVSTDFDARFSALWRRYSYTVCDDPRGPDPLHRAHQLAEPRELDLEAMNHAAAPLVGEHDFVSYCKVKDNGTTIREIHELRWEREVDERTGLNTAIMHVRADAFCHSMVRSLAGALIPVGQGRRPVDFPEAALRQRAREAGVTVMPAHPLVLEEVGYPPVGEWAARQVQTRTMRSTE